MRSDLPDRLKTLTDEDTPPKLRRLIEREVIPALLELRRGDYGAVVVPRLSLDRPASEQGLGSKSGQDD